MNCFGIRLRWLVIIVTLSAFGVLNCKNSSDAVKPQNETVKSATPAPAPAPTPVSIDTPRVVEVPSRPVELYEELQPQRPKRPLMESWYDTSTVSGKMALLILSDSPKIKRSITSDKKLRIIYVDLTSPAHQIWDIQIGRDEVKQKLKSFSITLAAAVESRVGNDLGITVADENFDGIPELIVATATRPERFSFTWDWSDYGDQLKTQMCKKFVDQLFRAFYSLDID